MKSAFVDSNVFLSFFTTGDKIQHEKAARLFRDAAAGKIALLTGPPVLFELAWTLRSGFGLTQESVMEVLSATVALPGLSLVDAPIVEKAIALAKGTRQEFADAYIAVSARAYHADSVATFNRKHFERLGAVLYPL